MYVLNNAVGRTPWSAAGPLAGPPPDTRHTSLALSVILHALAGVTLLLIRPDADIRVVTSSAHVTLIAPAPRVRRVQRFSMPAPRRPAARQFQAPHELSVSLPVTQPTLAAPTEVPIEVARVPVAQLPQLAVSPPIRTGILDEPHVDAQPAPRPSPVRSSGFGSESPSDPAPVATAKPAARTGGFGDASTAIAATRAIQSHRAGATTAVEILSKPRPLYTAEARRIGIQGEVVLEVLFRASGESQVLRIVRGLGYGLDESAMEAARQIRFRPAQRDGMSTDSSAMVHITFELAF